MESRARRAYTARPENDSFSSYTCQSGEIGRRRGFKIPRPQGCAGSSPASGTIFLLAVSVYPAKSYIPATSKLSTAASQPPAPAAKVYKARTLQSRGSEQLAQLWRQLASIIVEPLRQCSTISS